MRARLISYSKPGFRSSVDHCGYLKAKGVRKCPDCGWRRVLPSGMDRPTQTTKDREGVGRPSPLARTAYSIMGRVTAAMRDAGIDQSEIDDYLKRAMTGDYDNLLKVGMEMVDVSFS